MHASCIVRYTGADWTAAALAELCPPSRQQGNEFVSLFSANFWTSGGTAIIIKTFMVFFNLVKTNQ